MPPVIIWVVGTAGVFAVAKWIAHESARINAELHPHGIEAQGRAAEGVMRLRRDKATGVYRPEKA